MKQIMTLFLLVISASSFAGITEFSSKLESLETMYNIEFQEFLTEAEKAKLNAGDETKIVEALLRTKKIFDDFSNIDEEEDPNKIIDFRTFLNENLVLMGKIKDIDERVKLIGRYHIAVSNEVFKGDIESYYQQLKKMKFGFSSDEKLMNSSVRIYKNAYAADGEEDSIKEVKIKDLRAADMASIYNYFNKAASNSVSALNDKMKSKIGVTTSVEIMNAM